MSEIQPLFDPSGSISTKRQRRRASLKDWRPGGWHTAAVARRLLVDGCLPFANGIIGLGAETTWPKPTRPGGTLHLESEIIELTPSRSKSQQGIVTVRSTMFKNSP